MNYLILFFKEGKLCTCQITAENLSDARRTFESISDLEICHIQNTDEKEWRGELFLKLIQ
jgi:hypothetical protein